jgi:hypothetical protein
VTAPVWKLASVKRDIARARCYLVREPVETEVTSDFKTRNSYGSGSLGTVSEWETAMKSGDGLT